MFKRAWIKATILGFGALALGSAIIWSAFATGYSVGESRGEYYANSDTYSRQAELDIQRRCVSLGPAAQAACIREIVEAVNEHERSERDVVAQTEMAFWALGVFFVSGIGTIIAGFSLFLLRWTWNETKRTADIAQHAFLMSERPYVFITNVVPVHSLLDSRESWSLNPSMDFFSVSFDLQNHGKTPAIVKSVRASVRLVERLSGGPEYHSGEVKNWEFIIPAGRARSQGEFFRGKISPKQAEIIARTRRVHLEKAEKLRVFFYACVEYESVLGVRDKVMSAFLYDPIANDFMPNDTEGFNFRRYGEEKNA